MKLAIPQRYREYLQTLADAYAVPFDMLLNAGIASMVEQGVDLLLAQDEGMTEVEIDPGAMAFLEENAVQILLFTLVGWRRIANATGHVYGGDRFDPNRESRLDAIRQHLLTEVRAAMRVQPPDGPYITGPVD